MVGQGGYVGMQTNGGAWLAGGELGNLELGWENCTSGGGIGGGMAYIFNWWSSMAFYCKVGGNNMNWWSYGGRHLVLAEFTSHLVELHSHLAEHFSHLVELQ